MAKQQSKVKSKELLRSNFDLNKYKQKRGIPDASGAYKPQEWITFSEALQDVTSMPGIPKGHVSILRGHSDSGKTTCLIETAISAQKQGILPIFIITEMKWDWERLRVMGFNMDSATDEETGEVYYTGNFLYKDREQLKTIEDVAAFVLSVLEDQRNGDLPFDLLFMWDSVGSLPSQRSVESKANNNMWNAGAMQSSFGDYVNQEIVLSRKTSNPYTNTFVAVNKVWVDTMSSGPHGLPKIKNKGGNSLFFDATVMITFGNISDAGSSKIFAQKNGKKVEYAKKVNVQVDKNHTSNGPTTKGKIVMTEHGFIKEDRASIEKYKNSYKDYWISVLGGSDFELEAEDDFFED